MIEERSENGGKWMARYRENPNRVNNRNDSRLVAGVQILKSFGTIDSIGVKAEGQTCEGEGTEVEFSLNIYQTDSYYYGEIFLVDYDTRRKINSNHLIYFQQSSESQMICIFRIECENSNCTYQVIVSVSPTNCSTLANGMFYAYVPPIYNQGLNIGGVLKTGEVTICGSCDNGCSCNCEDSTN